MLLLVSPRSGHPRRASMLLLAAVLLFAVPAFASLPAASKCPPHIDCAKMGRRLCRRGSSQCGPCIPVLEEDQFGSCVVKRRHHPHGKTYPNLDEEIDFIHSYIEEQQISSKLSKHPVADDGNTKSEARVESANRPQSESQNATTPAPDDAAAGQTNTPAPQPGVSGVGGKVGPIVAPSPRKDHMVVSLVSLCVGVGALAVVLATVCYVKMQKKSHLTQKVDYPAYSRTGGPALANGASMGDKTLAQNAQMYHYQHQKQLMLSLGNHKPEQKVLDTEVTSDEEEVGGDFTVYECPGLAPTGEMEVKNPLFDDSTLHYQGIPK